MKLAKAGENQGDPKEMAPPTKAVEEDSENEEMAKLKATEKRFSFFRRKARRLP